MMMTTTYSLECKINGPHLPVGQDDEIQTVGDGAGDDDGQKCHSNVGQCALQPDVVWRSSQVGFGRHVNIQRLRWTIG